MHLIRRTALRSLQAQIVLTPARSFASRTSAITQARAAPSLSWSNRRFYSDEKTPAQQEDESAPKQEEQTVESAVSSAAETVRNAASSAAETASSALGAVTDAFPSRDSPEVGTTAPPSGTRVLYVGNLYFELSPELLRETFEKVGKVNNCRIVTDSTGMSKGFGYVEFEHEADAENAIRQFDQQPLEGRRMAVQYHVRKQSKGTPTGAFAPRNPPSRTLFVGNMSFQLSDNDLNDLFRSVKNVRDVRVAIDRKTGQPRGFAHADFDDTESAVEAKKQLEGKVLYGRPLRLDFGQPSVLSRRERQ